MNGAAKPEITAIGGEARRNIDFVEKIPCIDLKPDPFEKAVGPTEIVMEPDVKRREGGHPERIDFVAISESNLTTRLPRRF